MCKYKLPLHRLNPYDDGSSDGQPLNPLEVLFVKVKDFMLQSRWASATAAAAYDRWITDKVSDTISATSKVKHLLDDACLLLLCAEAEPPFLLFHPAPGLGSVKHLNKCFQNVCILHTACRLYPFHVSQMTFAQSLQVCASL